MLFGHECWQGLSTLLSAVPNSELLVVQKSEETRQQIAPQNIGLFKAVSDRAADIIPSSGQ